MSRDDNSFVKQAATLAIAGILARLMGFLYRLPLTDLIGDEGNTIYGVGFSIYNFFLIISSAGLPAAISKLVSEKRAVGRPDAAHRIFRVAFVLASSIGFVLMVAIFVFAEQITAALGTPSAYLALQTLAPTVFIVAMMAVIRGYFQGMSQAKPTAVSQLVEQFFNAIFSVVLAHVMWNYAVNQGHGAEAYGAAGGTLGTGVGALAGFVIIVAVYFLFRPGIMRQIRRRRYRGPTEGFGSISKSLAVTAFTIIAGTAVFSITNVIDVWLVRSRLYVAGFEDTAGELFGQLVGKFNPITNLPAAISSGLALAIIPAIAAASKRGRSLEVKQKVNTALRVGMLITIPIAFGLGALGPQIVALLFPNHPEGGGLFIAGFPSVIFLGISQISTGILQGIGRLLIPVVAAISGAAAKIAVSYILVAQPAINIYGAIIGTVLCYFVAATINCILLCVRTGARLDVKGILIKPAAAGAVMAVGSISLYHMLYLVIPSPPVATIIAIIGGMMLYTIFLMLIKGLREEDVRLLPKGEKLALMLKNRGFI